MFSLKLTVIAETVSKPALMILQSSLQSITGYFELFKDFECDHWQ